MHFLEVRIPTNYETKYLLTLILLLFYLIISVPCLGHLVDLLPNTFELLDFLIFLL